MKVLIVYTSFHHLNTLKIAQEIAKVLKARIVKPNEISPQDVAKYDLIGFGSGIYFGKHHKSLLEFVDRLPSLRDLLSLMDENKNVSCSTTNLTRFSKRARANKSISSSLSRDANLRKLSQIYCLHNRPNIFIFSTRGATLLGFSHKALRDKLVAKGFKIIGEFSYFGYDTFGPYGLIGGFKKGTSE